jgi:hypothetical protein
LNQIISERLVGLPVYAIVDADLDVDIGTQIGIEKWEYCTIENALLDSASIYEVLEPYREKTGIIDKDRVEMELLAICKESIQDEINRRLRASILPFHVQFKGKNLQS